MKITLAAIKKKLMAFPVLLDIKDKHHNRKMARFFEQFVGENKLFFDIGANFGNRTREFTLLGVRVIAVEPQDKCASFLNKRFRNEKVIVVHGAVGAEEKVAELLICENHGCSTFSEEWKMGRFSGLDFSRKQKAVMSTMENLIKKFGVPDFCKIDVEGYEEEVLKGLKTKIPALNFEFLPERMDIIERCLDMLEVLGYTLFGIVSGEEDQWALPFTTREAAVGFIKNKQSIDADYWGDIYAK